MRLLHCRIHIKCANDLESKDMNGKSDPYCLVSFDNHPAEFKSSVIENNLNPVWDQYFVHIQELGEAADQADNPEMDDLPRITFTLFDKDLVNDDFLGITHVVLNDHVNRAYNDSLVLEQVKKGTLTVEVIPMVYDITDLNRTIDVLNEDVNRLRDELIVERKRYDELVNSKRFVDEEEGVLEVSIDNNIVVVEHLESVNSVYKLNIEILEARDLISEDMFSRSSDPYVKVAIGDSIRETQVVHHNTNPLWNENIGNFFVEDLDTEINIEVFDWDRIGKHDSLGHARLNFGRLIHSFDTRSIAMSVPLENVKSGTVDMRLHYQVFTNH